MKLPVALLLALPLFGAEKWGVYEIRLEAPAAAGNLYTEVRLGAHFRYRNRTVDADGFYDGGSVYKHPIHAGRDRRLDVGIFQRNSGAQRKAWLVYRKCALGR